ncbi:TonB-dependent receptor [Massilia cavernae]|uniref:TonB-dependent receptor n=1 Tax=Massilia cavernae TaxID=2320864 RepID=A0A418XQR5_9BURK|nr:TonB-dependent receptor [Massilia cavernae]RJG14781.1 TonB-dependent receptor [Massilia cavernae]
MLEHTGFKRHTIASAVAIFLAGAVMAPTQAAGQEQSDASAGAIQEVIVTAQRVAQPASKTPLALSVVSGDDLKNAGAMNAASLTDLVPNVQIANNGGAMEIAIRGVSSADNTEKGDPSASFNIDGVNLARPQSAGIAFYDLERIEVLRGPQGTLYGRNATAGAVNLITNKPGSRFEGNVALQMGNYDTRIVDAMLNVPVNETLALRAAVSSSKHDGYLRSTQGLARNYDDQDSLSGRVHALFKFAPDVTLLLSADTSKTRGAGPGNVPMETFQTQSGDAQRTATPTVQGRIDNKANGYSAELNATLDVGTLTYQGAHRSFDRDEITPLGFGLSNPAPFGSSLAGYTQNSHELRLASKHGALKSILGLYWFRESSHIDVEFVNYPGLGRLAFIQDPTVSASKAAFGDLTIDLSGDLHLTLGLRRTKDEKSRQGYTIIGDPVIARGVNDAAVNYAQTTGKLSVDYALAKNIMAYVTASTGYKAGGFNDGTRATNPFLTYAPEHLTAIEVGIKGRMLNGRLQTSAALFGYNYRDLQLTSIVEDPINGGVTSQTRNAAKAKIAGLELEGKYAVTSNGRINFSATYLDAHYADYMPAQNIDWSGLRLDKSPRATLGLGYDHRWAMESGAELSAHVGTRYTSAYFISDFDTRTQYRQGGFHKSDATLTYFSATGNWYVQGYIRNIEDQTVLTSYSVRRAGLGAPRTAGVRVDVGF